MVINSTLIENFIEANFPGYKKNGEEAHFSSPFYPDKKQRLYINMNTGVWFDQKEQRGGSFVSFVSEYLGLSIADAYKVLESDYQSFSNLQSAIDIRDVVSQIIQPKVEEVEKEKDPLEINPVMFDEMDELDDDGEEAIRYLQNRRISPKGLGYFPKSDKMYGGRIFIPFYENEKLVYFLARSYTGSELRYKNPAGLDTDVVFNHDKITNTLAIFEGSFDAMALDNIVGTAMLSNKMKEGQAKKIMGIKSLKNIIFVPDKDKDPNVHKLILNNLMANYDLLNKYKRPSRKINFYIYNVPGDYKDFGEYKQNTGNGNIDLKDCESFDKNKIMFEIMRIS